MVTLIGSYLYELHTFVAVFGVCDGVVRLAGAGHALEVAVGALPAVRRLLTRDRPQARGGWEGRLLGGGQSRWKKGIECEKADLILLIKVHSFLIKVHSFKC